jgi:HEAT repeat protein
MTPNTPAVITRSLLAALSLALATPAQAAPRKPKPAAPADSNPSTQLSLEEIAVMLSSASADEVRMAIEASASLGTPDVIPLIQERVRAGLPPELLEVALDSVVLLGDPSAGELLAALTRHRRPNVRLKAVQAIVALKAVGAAPALERALSDSAPPVREAAAAGLGELGVRADINRLFLAFDRNVGSAARAIGRLAKDDDVARLLGYLGRQPLTSLTPAFDSLLVRKDLGEATKLRVVAQLLELGTAEARGYLEGLMQKLPADTPPRVRRSIDDAVARIAQ